VRAGSGARAEARDLMARAASLHGCRYVPAFHLALGYVGLEDHDRAMEALNQAWLDRDPAFSTITVEPRFVPLRDDPRYLELTERLNVTVSRDSQSTVPDSNPKG
jgi:hypothetical protein